jgi:7-keto-8-aminopelargonate synthetase-like enzyme
MTEPEPLQQVDRTFVHYGKRKLSYFSGCDYFRLSSHPEVLRSIVEGLKRFGLTVAASRLTTGNHRVYRQLERSLANFFDVEDALLLSGGYLTILVAAQSLARQFSHALVDERAHPAVQDAADLLDCPRLTFKHRDVDDFARAVARCGRGARPIALTDGMFSHDGSIAPLKACLKVLPQDGWILVDDAHAAGTLGKTGKGSLELEGVDRHRIVQCIALSKAFGAYGGAILGSRTLRERILDRSRMFRTSTPLALPLANAALTAIHILKSDRSLRRRLNENAARVKSALGDARRRLPETPSPIIPFYCDGERENARVKKRLLAAGIYPPFLKYPGGPEEGYFRFVISSEHSRQQLDRLIDVLLND